MDWWINVNNSDSANNSGVVNRTINCSLTTPLAYNCTYTWCVNVTDGIME